MVSLEKHLNSINFSTELNRANQLINSSNTCVKTTFWGSRVVEIDGYAGSVYLEDIASKIRAASKERCEADNLILEERIAGIEMVHKLIDFYRISDNQIKNSNFFTRLINWIREFSFVPYTTRFYFEQMAEAEFRAYSDAKFLQQFGGTFGELHHHPASDGFFGQRTLAKEDQIRALAAIHYFRYPA